MNDMKEKTGALLKEMAVLTGAVAIVAAGVYFFLVPSHYHRGQERVSEADEFYQPGGPQGICHHLQCVQCAVSA